MAGKSRATKWRAALVAQGGKAVGVTLTPEATKALDTLQQRFNLSQREAISHALEYAAAHLDPGSPEAVFHPGGPGFLDHRELLARLADMEKRILGLEGRPDYAPEADSPDFELESVGNPEGWTGTAGLSGEALDRLVDFSARRMREFGERVARIRLYEMARQEGVPIHASLHEYGTFLSLNMDRIRDRMKCIKDL